MKKFFKKLSFVLASAMVLTTFAPAAGAFAAAKPALNSTKKYLHLDKAGANEFDFNIKNKGKNWSYEWYTDNKSVATVNAKNGLVTAKGVGTTKVRCDITDKDDNLLYELSATVVIRDNIKTLKISNAPEAGSLAIGEEFDFNRSFVAVSGSTKKTSAITRWTVKEEGATIKDNGVFVATKAGTYTIVASAFQSKAKWESWKKDSTKYANYVLATAEYTVKVGANLVKTTQVDSTSFKVTFDADMSKEIKAEDVKLSRVVGTQNVAMKVEKVTFSADGKEMTVKSYIDFTSGSTYSFTIGEFTDSFKAATTEVTDVASIGFVKNAITTATATDLATSTYIKLYNADGVDITTAKLLSYVTIKMTSNLGNLNGTILTLFKNGDTAAVEATFHTYKYDEKFNEIVKSVTATITATDTDTSMLTDTIQYTLGGNFDKKTTTIAVGDPVDQITFRYYTADAKTTYTTVTADGVNFKFESSNSDIAIVQPDGTVYPAATGNVVVILYKANADKTAWTAIGTVEITVVGSRTASQIAWSYNGTATLSTNTSMGSSASGINTNYAQLSIKDQTGADLKKATLTTLLGSGFGNNKIKCDVLVKPSTSATAPTVTASVADDGKLNVTFKANETTTVGNYVFKITVDGVSTTASITVVDGTTDTAAKSWAISFNYGSNSVDLKGDGTRYLALGVYGYNAKGAIVNDISSDYWLTGAGAGHVEITVKDANGKDFSSAIGHDAYGNRAIVATSVAATGSAVNTAGATLDTVTDLPAGTYTISVTVDETYSYLFGSSNVVNGKICNDVTFTVTDSTTKTVVQDASVVKTTGTNAVSNLSDAVKKAFSIYINGNKVTDAKEANITAVKWTKGTTTATTTKGTAIAGVTIASGDIINISSITYAVEFDGEYREYEITVNKNITVD